MNMKRHRVYCGLSPTCHENLVDLSRTMKLDATDLRYMTPEEFRVLTAVRAP
jgi:hypothetical protein